MHSKKFSFAATAVLAVLAVVALVDPAFAAVAGQHADGVTAFLSNAGVLAASGAALRGFRSQKATLVASLNSLVEKATAEKRDLSAEETAEFDKGKASLASLNAQIERTEFLLEQSAGMAGGVEIPAQAVIQVSENQAEDPKRGFKSFGDFARAVRNASAGVVDRRLTIGAAAPSTAANEGAGADGGFMVPPAYSSELFRLSLADDALLPYTSNVPVEGNSMVFPKTEQTPWGTNGVRAYWQAEATAGTPTKPVLGTQALRLHKLMALIPLTDELMADATALQAEITPLATDSLRWKINEAILYGNGNGQPLGALASTGPVITHAKDSGQAANTLSATNLMGMLSRLINPMSTKAVWVIHPSVLPVLGTLTLGQIPIFLPSATTGPGAIQGSPSFGTLLGRPVIISLHAAALSSAGDVQLHDLSYYRTITKAAGVETATSMHLYFDADATALRLTFRIDGSPKIASAVSPAKGSTTLSPFIQLQNR